MLANEGKFTDRYPGVLAAGKLTAGGYHTSDCMKTDFANRPTTPDIIAKFKKNREPPAGQKKAMLNAYNNIDLVNSMVHGAVSASSQDTVKKAVNPHPKTAFQQKILDGKESIYESKQNKPLGQIPDQTNKLGKGVNIMSLFGKKSDFDIPAGIVVNPRLTSKEVDHNAREGYDLYRTSHLKTEPGEQKYYSYDYGQNGKPDVFGLATPHDNRGVHVMKCMDWKNSPESRMTDRQAAFLERTKPKLGEVHDPIKDTLNVADDHAFGVMIATDEHGAGNLIHHREAAEFIKNQDRERGAVAAVREQLKKANYHNFEDLKAAFDYYDPSKKGKLNVDDLLRVCASFHLPVDANLINDLIAFCDCEGNGEVSYIDFCNFLNWRYDLPNEKLTESPPGM